MAQAASRRPVSGLVPRSFCVGFVVDELALVQVFPELFGFLCLHRSTSVPYVFIHLPPTVHDLSN